MTMKLIFLLYLVLSLPFAFAGCEKDVVEAQSRIKPTEATEQTTSLHQAASDGDIEQVRLLLSKGADVNAQDEKKRTPLCHAVKSGKMELVQMLVHAGADLNIGRRPPLSIAISENNVTIAKYLIAHGANINAPEDWTALQQAPYISDNIEMVELLIAKGADINAGPYTALHGSVDKDRKDIAEMLITKGANVDAKDSKGRTPLYLAAWYQPEMVEFFLAHGADVNTKDNNGKTPLHLVLDFTIRKKHKVKDVVELLIDKGADVNSKDKEGRTPLYLAAESADEDVIELLLAKGARIDEEDDEHGFTALHYAARFGNKDAAELLIDKGAAVDAKDKEGHTPLYIAVNHDYKVAELLMNKSADGAIKTEAGQTLFQLAHERKQVESTVPDKIFDGEPNSSFGRAIAFGDINNDGYDDIIISGQGYDRNRGRLYLFYGGKDVHTNPDLIFEGDTEASKFGNTIALGDIDNDGYDDIVIGAHWCKNNDGRVYLYWGGPRESFNTHPDKVFDGEADKGGYFGAGVGSPAIYDIDNDGYRDIIISAIRYPGDFTGRTYLYYGNTKERMDTSYDLIFTAENPGDCFGIAIDCGDVNNDGYGDIIIGARGYPSKGSNGGAGRAYLYYGASQSDMDANVDKVFDAESEDYNCFGQGIVCFDQNKDGFDDILIGAQAYRERQGRVYLFYGNTRSNLDTVPDKIFDGEIPYSDYGFIISCGDIDGDNKDEIVIGADYLRHQVGRVYVYWGIDLSGPNPKPGRIFTGENPGEWFSQRLACGDVNNDGYDDLIIGAKGYKAGSEQGRAYLYYGGPR